MNYGNISVHIKMNSDEMKRRFVRPIDCITENDYIEYNGKEYHILNMKLTQEYDTVNKGCNSPGTRIFTYSTYICDTDDPHIKFEISYDSFGEIETTKIIKVI